MYIYVQINCVSSIDMSMSIYITVLWNFGDLYGPQSIISHLSILSSFDFTYCKEYKISTNNKQIRANNTFHIVVVTDMKKSQTFNK